MALFSRVTSYQSNKTCTPSLKYLFSKRSFSAAKKKNLTLKTMNEKVLEAEYAVRGELVMRAEQHAKTLAACRATNSPNPLPFDDILYCNIGNPQALNQKPITFSRQIISLIEYPELLRKPIVTQLYPRDVIERVKMMLSKIPGGVGAYTHSQGFPFVRRAIADFIERRDGYECDPENIFLYNGASPGIQHVLRLLLRSKNDGIMTPIPQYPLYSATIKMLGGSQVGYYLNEDNNWSLSIDELNKSYDKSVSNDGIVPRALVIINPGNPTGQVLSIDNMKDIIQFCNDKNIILLADEVYQENVYIKDKRPFNSFKKVLRILQEKSTNNEYDHIELFSFHSISKGFFGECGHRGGYTEAVGLDIDVRAQLYKLASILLCPNTAGQILLSTMVNPPVKGDESYELYKKERDTIYDSLKRRSLKLHSFFNSLEGVSCNDAQGAMYLFPKITIPKKAVDEAINNNNKSPDTFYSISMLDSTGICVVPGSGFGQKDGTYHFRTTFLPQEDQIDKVTQRMGKFHSEFMSKYR